MAKSSAYKKYLAKLNKIAINVQAYTKIEDSLIRPKQTKNEFSMKFKDVEKDIIKELDIINITEIPETVFEEE